MPVSLAPSFSIKSHTIYNHGLMKFNEPLVENQEFKSSKFVGYSTEDERLRHVQPVKPLRAVVDGSGPSLIRALEGLRQFPPFRRCSW
jgi:hypothetical protein